MFYLIMRTIAYMLLRPMYFLSGGLRFEGQENIPRTGGVLITPNHVSFADPPTVAMGAVRFCYVMAWDALFKIPVLGVLIRWLRGFPVKPGTPDRASLRYAEDLLKRGEAVIIFPEGGVSKTGNLLPVLPGALLLAQRTNVPIVPTIVVGTNALLPYEKVLPRRTKHNVVVRYGKPVTIDELTDGVKGSDGLRKGAARLHAMMLELQNGEIISGIEPQK